VRAFGPPALDGVGPVPFPALQAAFDAFYVPGLQWYWRADFVDELSDAAIDLHAQWGAALPTLHSTMHLYPIDAAVHRVGAGDTAFAYRSTRWSAVFAGVDPDRANAGAIREWATGYQEALHPYAASGGGAYVNFLMAEDGAARVHDIYGDNYAKLAATKARYDPANLFHVNQNIAPEG
jgi:FAD/FMN-containing dehydrogenase